MQAQAKDLAAKSGPADDRQDQRARQTGMTNTAKDHDPCSIPRSAQ